jgi:hypothetical protein
MPIRDTPLMPMISFSSLLSINDTEFIFSESFQPSLSEISSRGFESARRFRPASRPHYRREYGLADYADISPPHR